MRPSHCSPYVCASFGREQGQHKGLPLKPRCCRYIAAELRHSARHTDQAECTGEVAQLTHRQGERDIVLSFVHRPCFHEHINDKRSQFRPPAFATEKPSFSLMKVFEAGLCHAYVHLLNETGRTRQIWRTWCHGQHGSHHDAMMRAMKTKHRTAGSITRGAEQKSSSSDDEAHSRLTRAWHAAAAQMSTKPAPQEHIKGLPWCECLAVLAGFDPTLSVKYCVDRSEISLMVTDGICKPQTQITNKLASLEAALA